MPKGAMKKTVPDAVREQILDAVHERVAAAMPQDCCRQPAAGGAEVSSVAASPLSTAARPCRVLSGRHQFCEALETRLDKAHDVLDKAANELVEAVHWVREEPWAHGPAALRQMAEAVIDAQAVDEELFEGYMDLSVLAESDSKPN